MFKATFDPRRPTVAPPREESAAASEFRAHGECGREALARSAERYHKALSQKQAGSERESRQSHWRH